MGNMMNPSSNYDAEQMYYTAEEILSMKDVLKYVSLVPVPSPPRKVLQCTMRTCVITRFWPCSLTQLPHHKYMYGYNKDAGDKGILFKFWGLYEVSRKCKEVPPASSQSYSILPSVSRRLGET